MAAKKEVAGAGGDYVKATVSNDALDTLGTIIGPQEHRDAIHLAVDPVVADEELGPGLDVGFMPNGRVGTKAAKLVGIVDPFLQEHVKPGQYFWLVVYPRKITSLRHVWTHPDFANVSDEVKGADENEVADSKTWNENYVEELNQNGGAYDYTYGYPEPKLTYEELMETAKEHVEDSDKWGSYLVKGGLLEGVGTKPEFWKHFEVVTGIKVPAEKATNFFSCSC